MGSEGGTTMRTTFFLIFFAISIQAQQDYQSDSLAVRIILDTNGLQSVPIDSVATSIGGRIVALDLDDANLSILPECIGRLAELQLLIITWGGFQALPDSLFNLKKLEYLDLSVNVIRVLPDAIGELPRLRHLNLFSYNVRAFKDSSSMLPASIGMLDSLQYLNLRWNFLTSLPSTIVNLKALDTLDLSENRLCSLPPEIALWADAHDSTWRLYQDCTPIIMPVPCAHSIELMQTNSPFGFYNLQGRMLGVIPFAQVNDRLRLMSSGAYLLVLPDGKGAAKAISAGR
jgi:hypothetical protein